MFYKGFTEEEFKKQVGEFKDSNDFIFTCLNDENKFQLKLINEEVLNQKITEANLNDDDAKKLKKLFNQHILSKKEIEDRLIEIGKPFLEVLLDVWKNSAMKNMSLTSVGIAIAQANYRRKTGQTLDLSLWIK